MTKHTIACVAMGAAVLAGGCASRSARAPKIQDEWVARLPSDQMGSVEQARENLARAQENQTRAQLAVNDADNDLSVKKSMRDASASRQSAARKTVDAAKDTGDRAMLDKANAAYEQAEKEHKVAEADYELSKVKREVARSEEQLAKARVETQQARTQKVEFLALRRNGDTRVEGMDESEFDEAISSRAEKEKRAQERIVTEQGKIASAQDRVRSAQQETGIGGGGNQGRSPSGQNQKQNRPLIPTENPSENPNQEL